MSVSEKIISLQNPRIKNVVKLQQKASERRAQGLFAVEGLKEIDRAISFDYQVVTIFFCADILNLSDLKIRFPKCADAQIIEVSHSVYSKISYREDSGGLVVLFRTKTRTLNDLRLPENPLILISDSVEKPGNIGAILRTADSAGVDAVLFTGTQTDIFNPNTIRSSVGSLFSVPIVETSIPELVLFLANHSVSIYCTHLEASVCYTDIDFRSGSAVVMGTESTGISDEWLKFSKNNIIIPMQGSADSMNVSVSAAIILFEAARQRGFGKTF